MTFGCLNCGGLQDNLKRQHIANLGLDIIVLTETHLQQQMLYTESEQFPEYHCLWGSSPNDRHFSGVAILARKSSFWAAKPLRWCEDDECFQYYKDCRLHASQLWFGRGGTSMIVYAMYGQSGAHWEKSKKAYTHDLISSITRDSIARGSIPAILMGDMNLQISDSKILADLLKSKTWHDLRTCATIQMAKTDTCHKGKGSQIDHIFVTTQLFDQCHSFVVTKFDTFKDHACLQAKMILPTCEQMVTTIRQPFVFPDLKKPQKDDSLYTDRLGSHYHHALETQEVDEAFALWSREAERILVAEAVRQGCPCKKQRSHRGQVQFHEQRRHPKTVQLQASTLCGRRLWKLLNQATEMSKMQIGTRFDRTFENFKKNLKALSSDLASQVQSHIEPNFSPANAVVLCEILQKLINDNNRQDRHQRLKKWKERLQNSDQKVYKWIKSKSQVVHENLSKIGGHLTSNYHARLNAISTVWKRIYTLHKNGEPSLRSFMEVFGEKLQRHLVTLEPITADDILRTLNKTKPSAAGLDHFLPGELKILAKWAPSLMVKLAQLFAVIESTSKWPKVLVKGSISFIPKTDDVENLSADQYRPITILSAIYRLWSSIRHDQLVESWYARWRHPQAFGGKDSRPADVLAFEVSLQLAEALQSQKFVGGVSYDLQKCFDSVPTNLCLQIFRIRGAPNLVVDSMLSFYQQHEKYFKIDGCYSEKFKPVNGIIQGDPMSMLLLVSLITSWLENQPSQLTSTTGRSYVDDLSTISLSDSLKELKTAVQVSHQYTCDFVRQVGMTMNHSKTFTFGNPKLKNILPNVDSHKEQFRLVGGSIKSSTKTTWTHLEQQRQDKWQSTMARIRFVPKGWFTKVKLMQKYTSQLTWGQGTHSLSLSVNRQRALRASVIKSLLNVTDYSASPKVIFCLLAPPALEAEYALHLSALRLVMRIYSSPEKRHQLDDLVAQLPPNAIDGPYKRIAQLRAHPIFANTYQKFIADQLHPNKWQHELREDFRKHHWQLLCRDRGHHFGGTTRGVKKNLTTHLLQKWAQEADSMDNSIIDPENDPRPRMKILRLLLAGGLMTPERDHRHRRKQGKVLCSCGEATPDVIHISWHCKKYQQLRSRAIEVLPKPLNQLPVCFQYATIVPVDLDIDQAALTIIQTTLVTNDISLVGPKILKISKCSPRKPYPMLQQMFPRQLNQFKVSRLVVKAMSLNCYLVMGFSV